MTRTSIANALISVSDKTGIADFARELDAMGVRIISTGGTAALLEKEGIAVTPVSDVTGAPEMMDGRVKTLNPIIHGGILARRDMKDHLAAMEEHQIPEIDLVVVNLYPFGSVLTRADATREELVENIDIGGPAMIRAAAKNHDFVTVVTDADAYQIVLNELRDGGVTEATRQCLAARAYAHTACYDAAIAAWMRNDGHDDTLPQSLAMGGMRIETLRYGENPHQEAALYHLPGRTSRAGVLTASQIQGKPLSYNNINDTDAAFELVAEFDAPSVAIIKHANPSGVASHDDIRTAWQRALACDPVSAFGGIIALNRPLEADLAEDITRLFTEVVIAPGATADAKAVMAAKPNLRLLVTDGMPDPAEARLMIRSVSGGFLAQSADTGQISETDLECVTRLKPSPGQITDMLFAMRVAKHVKSNAIVYARDSATVAVGAGQMSRLDSSRIAAQKAADLAREAGFDVSPIIGSVVASDAFFPFPDGLLAAASAGATAVIQPGGSMKDDEVIAAADEAGLAMVFTGMRHFRH
ncbi:bifunctional phosphoribosylaminoimidazolecarboxamide formyltransferase/IMP cyclohydrolase [Alphaproteobacteria bacterium LSUCC0684]